MYNLRLHQNNALYTAVISSTDRQAGKFVLVVFTNSKVNHKG